MAKVDNIFLTSKRKMFYLPAYMDLLTDDLY